MEVLEGTVRGVGVINGTIEDAMAAAQDEGGFLAAKLDKPITSLVVETGDAVHSEPGIRRTHHLTGDAFDTGPKAASWDQVFPGNPGGRFMGNG